jgi:Fe-S-cluster containining protein
MEREYDKVAEAIGLTCRDCPDNCCDSFFLHHTYVEWAYLWEGLRAFDQSTLVRIQGRSAEYVKESKRILEQGERPQLKCPLLTIEGLCGLYKHRLMICRMHGVPNSMTLPDGQSKTFNGCFRCQGIIADQENPPTMDRTPLYRELAMLENELLEGKRHLYPRVKLTIAEMISSGPPRIPKPHCER